MALCAAAIAGCGNGNLRWNSASDSQGNLDERIRDSITQSGIREVTKRYERLKSFDFEVNYQRFVTTSGFDAPEDSVGNVSMRVTGNGRWQRAESGTQLRLTYKRELPLEYHKRFFTDFRRRSAVEHSGDEWLDVRCDLNETQYKTSLKLLGASVGGKQLAIEDAANSRFFFGLGIDSVAFAHASDRIVEYPSSRGCDMFVSLIGNPFGSYDRSKCPDSFIDRVLTVEGRIWEKEGNSDVFTATSPGYHSDRLMVDAVYERYKLHIDPTTKFISKIEYYTTPPVTGPDAPFFYFHYSLEFRYSNINYGVQE